MPGQPLPAALRCLFLQLFLELGALLPLFALGLVSAMSRGRRLREAALLCCLGAAPALLNSLALAVIYDHYVVVAEGPRSPAVPSFLSFRRHLVELFNNCTFGSESWAAGKSPPRDSASPWDIIFASGRFHYPWDVSLTLVALSGLFNVLVLLAVKSRCRGGSSADAAAPAADPVATPALAAATVAAPGAAQTSASTRVPTASTVGTQTLAEDSATTETSETGDEAERVPVSVTPTRRCTAREGPQRPSEEEEPNVTTHCLLPRELQDIREDLGRFEGEQHISWLLRCWDNGANDLNLTRREVQRLGPLARDLAFDRCLGRDPQPLTLWKRLLLVMRKRYPYVGHEVYQTGKWRTIEGGIRNLRLMAVRELVFSDLENPLAPLSPYTLKVTEYMWRSWLRSGPPLHANRVAEFFWEDETPTVNYMETLLLEYADSLSSSQRTRDSPVEEQSGQSAELLDFQPRRPGPNPSSAEPRGATAETTTWTEPAEVPEELGAAAAPVPTEVLRARSSAVVCGICMDRVYEKRLPEERLFGILPNCSHAYCVSCIRQWRRSREFENEIIKACPECRVTSSYYIPHKYWVSDVDEKEKLIKSFKARTGKIRCKFFVRNRGRCPFKSDCIYLHELPPGPLPRRRRRPRRVPLEFSLSLVESSDEADEELYMIEADFELMGTHFGRRMLYTDYSDSD